MKKDKKQTNKAAAASPEPPEPTSTDQPAEGDLETIEEDLRQKSRPPKER